MDNQATNDGSQGSEIQRSNDEIDRILNISLQSITSVPQRQLSNEGRYCWVCFATEEEDQEAGGAAVEWIKPCKCKGTLRWVHQSCLQVSLGTKFNFVC